MSEVFHESDQSSIESSIESSSSEVKQEDNEDKTSSSDEDVEERGNVADVGEVREGGELSDENNSGLVKKSNLEKVKSPEKDVAVKPAGKPEAKIPKWNNQRLFPPSSKCKSKAWKFGGFLKDEKTGQLLTKETICGFCGLKQNYRCSPNNLDQHMQAVHSLEYEGVGKKMKERSKIDDFFLAKTNSKYKATHPKQKEVRKALGEWVVDSNRPLSAVEDPKLVKAFLAADSKSSLGQNDQKRHRSDVQRERSQVHRRCIRG